MVGDDRGQATPVVALVVVLAAVVALALGRAGGVAVDAARARTAADAAALAGAAEGRDGAVRMAAANGAELVRYVSSDGDVVVTVRVGPVTEQARARRERGGSPGP